MGKQHHEEVLGDVGFKKSFIYCLTVLLPVEGQPWSYPRTDWAPQTPASNRNLPQRVMAMKTVFSPALQTCRGGFNIREEERERKRGRGLCMMVVQTLTHPVTWRREEGRVQGRKPCDIFPQGLQAPSRVGRRFG